MNTTQKLAVSAAAVILMLGMGGCTMLGAGIGAVAGSGSTVGMLGGAVIGGVIGHEISN